MRPLEYLKRLESYGYSSYIVGGYVRDKILGISSSDIDIATSASPREVAKIFAIEGSHKLGCVSIKKDGYTVDITTFRKESDYNGRHPKSIVYVEDILEDLERRDFTINAICMDSNGKIYDPLRGVADLKVGRLCVIGDINKKLTEDPLRMLRAMRFAIIYDLTIDREVVDFIKTHGYLLKSISMNRKRAELDKIFASQAGLKGLNYLAEMGLLDDLSITMPNVVKPVVDLIGIWSQLECSAYPFNRVEKMRISNIRKILDKKSVDVETLFEYGLYDNLVAGEILGQDRKEIFRLHNKMGIHSKDELAIDGKRIMEILKVKESPLLKEIKNVLISEILSGNLSNSGEVLAKYVYENKEVIKNGRYDR